MTDISPDADRLKAMLAEHVREMVDVGHLGPYYAKRGELNPRWYFTNPGDTVWALSRALRYLPGDLQEGVRRYLRREMSDYPPLSDALNAPETPGRSRMDFVVPKHL